jgi:hypothetical protein
MCGSMPIPRSAASSSIFAELVAQIPQFATARLHPFVLLNPRVEDVDRKALVVREIDGRMAVDSTLDLFDDQMPANMKGCSILELLRLLPVQRHAVLRCLEVDDGVRHGERSVSHDARLLTRHTTRRGEDKTRTLAMSRFRLRRDTDPHMAISETSEYASRILRRGPRKLPVARARAFAPLSVMATKMRALWQRRARRTVSNGVARRKRFRVTSRRARVFVQNRTARTVRVPSR